MIKAIDIKGLSYQYENGAIALKEIDLCIEQGARVAILGHNGAGKSTLIQHLNGLLMPQRGSIQVAGLEVNKVNLKEIRRKVGLLFQDPDDQILAPTVWEDLAFGPENLGYDSESIADMVTTVAKRLQINDLLTNSPQNLSLGQKKKVALAGVLIVNPDILLLDEPFAYLDQQGQDEIEVFLREMAELNKTLVMVTHDLDRAWQWADNQTSR